MSRFRHPNLCFFCVSPSSVTAWNFWGRRDLLGAPTVSESMLPFHALWVSQNRSAHHVPDELLSSCGLWVRLRNSFQSPYPLDSFVLVTGIWPKE